MDKQTKSGVFNAVAAYLMWGIAPMYFKLIEHVSSPEILVHRIIWSFVLLIVVVFALRQWSKVQAILRDPKVILKLLLSSILLGTNWLLFIWSINNDHLLDASLGYYINPLLNVALGMVFLGERLRPLQLFAVLLAVVGVMVQVISLGTLPIISLALAGTFGIYGLIRKKVMVDSLPGLLMESSLLLPMAVGYWLFFMTSDTSNMANNHWHLNALLLAAGLVTTVPLLCFTAAAKRLTLASLGFFQYIGPSLMFILAVFLYNEPLVIEKTITFGFIWLALIIYSADSIRTSKRA